jgi:hypothetical protein
MLTLAASRVTYLQPYVHRRPTPTLSLDVEVVDLVRSEAGR